MDSAFGVDHGYVAKSMLPGGAFKPIKAMTGAERTGVKTRITDAQRYRKDDADFMGFTPARPKNYERGINGRGRTIRPKSQNQPFSHEKKVEWHAHDSPLAANTTTDGGHLSAGGRAIHTSHKGGGVVQMFGKPGGSTRGTANADILTHEMRHLGPKRNPVRLAQRLEDPVRRGREEGRADFGIKRGQPYPGSKEFRSGYEDVQSRMAAAQKKKR